MLITGSIILLLAAIIWILYSKTKGFTNSTRVSVRGYARFFTFKPEWWNKHYLQVVSSLIVLLLVLSVVKSFV